MYNISYFKANDPADVLAFMKAHPFVVLCGVAENGMPVATHLPVMIVERNDRLFLQAHAMRNQKHTIAFENNPNVLVIFQGAHSYISAQLYNPKNVASTWNYSAVHANGLLRLLSDTDLYHILQKLTNHFEGSNNSPASFENLEENYIRENMKAIVGFEIEITHLQHVFKLSQNKSADTKDSIIHHLANGSANAQEVASEMKKSFKND